MASSHVLAAVVLLGAFALAATQPAVVGQWAGWDVYTNQAVTQHGDGTYYGAGQDSMGTCSFSENFANTNNLAWTTSVGNTIALNDPDFDNSVACGMCVMYRGTGTGIGLAPFSTTTWTRGFVNNRCPECLKGSLDMAMQGDGRWQVEWYAVDCLTGATPLNLQIVVSSQYFFNMVVSNTPRPIQGVRIFISGKWLALPRSNNNQWAYYNSDGAYSFPLKVQVIDTKGQCVQDTLTAAKMGAGTVNFDTPGNPYKGVPCESYVSTYVASSSASTASAPASSATTANPLAASSVASPPPASPVAAAAVASPSPVAAAAVPASPSPVAAAAIPASPSPVAAAVPASPSPVASAAVVASPPPASPAVATTAVGNFQQCGGSGANCGGPAAPCTDAQWPNTACNVGYVCRKATDWNGVGTNWQCQAASQQPSGRRLLR